MNDLFGRPTEETMSAGEFDELYTRALAFVREREERQILERLADCFATLKAYAVPDALIEAIITAMRSRRN